MITLITLGYVYTWTTKVYQKQVCPLLDSAQTNDY